MQCNYLSRLFKNATKLTYWDYLDKYWTHYRKALARFSEWDLVSTVFNNEVNLLWKKGEIIKNYLRMSKDQDIANLWLEEIKKKYWVYWEFIYHYVNTIWFFWKDFRGQLFKAKPFIYSIDLGQFIQGVKWINVLKILSWLWLENVPVEKVKKFFPLKGIYWDKRVKDILSDPEAEKRFFITELFDAGAKKYIWAKKMEDIATAFYVWQKLINNNQWFFSRIINSVYSWSAWLYGFLKYTLSPLSWWLMFWISVGWYEMFEKIYWKWILNDAVKWREELWIMTQPVYKVVYQTLWEIQAMEEWGDMLSAFYTKLNENIRRMLEDTNLTDKERAEIVNYIQATKNWIHNVADLMYDEWMRNITFLMAMEYMHWVTPDMIMWGKFVKRWDEAFLILRDWQAIKIWNVDQIKDETYNYYKKLKAYWTFTPDNVRVGSLKMFEKLFNFYWNWGLIMMHNFMTSLPLSVYYLYKSKTAPKSMREEYLRKYLFYKWLTLTMLWSIINAWYYWSQVYKFRDKKNEYSENEKVSYIEHMLKSSKIFSVWLQAFDSNVYWRLFQELFDFDNPTSVWYRMFTELNRDFLKNLHLVDPFASAAWSFIKDQDVNKAATILFNWFNSSLEWYVRFLWNNLPDWLDWYTLPEDWNKLLDLVLWEKTWIRKTYADMRELEKNLDIDYLLKKWDYKDIIMNYVLMNFPILKWLNKVMFFDDKNKATAEKLEAMYDALSNDENFQRMRYEWKLPDIDTLPEDIKRQYVQYLYKRLTTQFPYYAKFDKNEMKQIMYTLNDKFLENNIVAKALKKALEKWDITDLYKIYLEAYKAETPEQENLIRQNAYVMSLLQTKIPWAAYKIMGYIFNNIVSRLRKERFGTMSTQKVPTEAEYKLEEDMVKAFYPALMFHDDWSGNINALLYTEAIAKYVELMHPEFKNLFSYKWSFDNKDVDSFWINKKIMKLLLTDLVTQQKINKWDISAAEIKSVFSLLWWKLFRKDEQDLKASFLATVMDKINKTLLDDTTKTNIYTWMILANLDVFDKIKEKWIPKWAENTYKKLIQYLFNTRKKINWLENMMKLLNNTDKKWEWWATHYWKNKYNNNYNKNYPHYNAFKKYYNKWYNSFKPYYSPYKKNWWWWGWWAWYSYPWFYWQNGYNSSKWVNLSPYLKMPKLYHINSQAITKRLIHDLPSKNKNEARWFTVKAPSISRAKPTGIPWLTSGRRR